MPSREIHCTVNLEIWYSIDGLYRPYHVPQDQLYDYISYSKHKRRQLSDRLAIARNKIQCNYIMPSGSIKPKNIMPIKLVYIFIIYKTCTEADNTIQIITNIDLFTKLSGHFWVLHFITYLL